MRARKPPASIDLDAHRILVTRLSDSSSDEEEVEDPDASSTAHVEVTDLGSTLHDGMDDSHAAGAYEGGELHINPKLMSKLEELRSVIARDTTAATLGLHARRWSKKLKGRGSGSNTERSSGAASPTSSRDDANAALILWRSPDELLGVHDNASTPAPFAFGQAAAVDVEEAHKAAPRDAPLQASPTSAPASWPVPVTSEFAGMQAAAPMQSFSSAFVTPSYAFSSAPTSAPPMQHSVWPSMPEHTKAPESFWLSTSDMASDGEAMQLD